MFILFLQKARVAVFLCDQGSKGHSVQSVRKHKKYFTVGLIPRIFLCLIYKSKIMKIIFRMHSGIFKNLKYHGINPNYDFRAVNRKLKNWKFLGIHPSISRLLKLHYKSFNTIKVKTVGYVHLC